jgi:hypothetical protein
MVLSQPNPTKTRSTAGLGVSDRSVRDRSCHVTSIYEVSTRRGQTVDSSLNTWICGQFDTVTCMHQRILRLTLIALSYNFDNELKVCQIPL